MKLNEQQFLSQIEKNKGAIIKVSRMYMDNLEDQQDLFQEIVMQLWRSYGSFREESLFSTWLYRVAINTALIYLKKEKRRPDQHELTKDHDIVEEFDFEKKEEQLRYFYQAVQHLNAVEKALIFLFLEGQSHRNIATNLGISEVNARVKLNRTKEKLQQIIKTQGYEF
ncbi:sigma-70 family RNA polymerase sigma factor [Sphingobacterium sp. SRCM116780]|uniref:RNA polymerase sigma factor n=1 Tax=Sphingobacterium sp. SRCM116780 TaxID=2907623 RepID=UPI001F456D28|nr:sigma-70 family RNA polymerase sigma factor [Sphingobacterium sp. SRCM116780]UIR54588.1 sigma-70 family RNA polymerase sigma factor [Sphingobacterium sp. SRCM116780]